MIRPVSQKAMYIYLAMLLVFILPLCRRENTKPANTNCTGQNYIDIIGFSYHA